MLHRPTSGSRFYAATICAAILLLAAFSVAAAEPGVLSTSDARAFEFTHQPGDPDPVTGSPLLRGGEECGTVVTPEQVAYELSLNREDWLKKGLDAQGVGPYRIPIAFHVVRRTDASGGLDAARLDVALRDLNMQFEQVGIQYFRERVGGEFVTYYVDSDAYYYGTNNSSMYSALRQEGPVPDMINVWFVPFTTYCGLASLPGSSVQGIIMDNYCTGLSENPATLAHEVGHYLGLYHTHHTNFGVECPDGSNCDSAGDLLCDTPADPNLSGKIAECQYIGTDTLPTGCSGTYDPAEENQMSYAPARCRDTFSPEQISKMLYTLTEVRPDHFPTDSTDSDGDGVIDVADCCPDQPNADQTDTDGDHKGDLCDAFPLDPLNDADGDGISAEADNCPTVANADQADADGNGVGDACGCIDGYYRFFGETEKDLFGWRVRNAGDVDGDGHDDIIVGADAADWPAWNIGAAYVYSGSNGALLYHFTGEEAGDLFGNSVCGTGDLNGDGYGDMMVGAWDNDAGGADAGRVYVFYATPGAYPIHREAATADRVYTGAYVDVLGSAVDRLDDITGDGVPELLMGAWYGAYVQVRDGQSGTLIYNFTGDAAADGFGYSLRNAGDVNADGTPDIIVGAYQGRYARVFSGEDGSVIHTFTGGPSDGGFGGMVAAAGDVDADGHADLLVGVPSFNCGVAEGLCGRAIVYSGAGGFALYEFQGEESWDLLGWAVDGVGDVDADGFDDFAIGIPVYNGSDTRSGRVQVYSGQLGTLLHTIEGFDAGDWFGRDICGAVDVDQDGVRDLMVGAFRYDGTGYRSGGVFVYQLGDLDRDGLLVGCDMCGVGLTGDVNLSFERTSADIIYMVNFVFKSGPAPLPCEASGDVNCDEAVTSADVIYMVNHNFKSGPLPCDVCTMVPEPWDCP